MTTRHPTVTDEGRRLLEGATPGPWDYKTFDATIGWSVVSGIGDAIADLNFGDTVGDQENNAALIVYAVNHLPAFLAAVEALQRITKTVYSDDAPLDSPSYSALHLECIREARAALAPFTEEPSDD